MFQILRLFISIVKLFYLGFKSKIQNLIFTLIIFPKILVLIDFIFQTFNFFFFSVLLQSFYRIPIFSLTRRFTFQNLNFSNFLLYFYFLNFILTFNSQFLNHEEFFCLLILNYRFKITIKFPAGSFLI